MHETRRTAQPSDGPLALLVATKKGAFVLRADAARREFALEGPHFLGHIVNHLVLDPRDRRTLLCAARTGHLGPTIFRSSDLGGSWKEASKPPAFPAGDPAGRTVKHTFWLEPASAAEPGVWYAGVSPQALFRSEDAGDTWSSVASFNDHPRWLEWTGKGQDGTPDGSILHSINVDPRDPRHLYVGLSGGGVFECVNGGKDWRPLNGGLFADFNPVPYPEFGQDPHCMRLHPLAPDVLWQQSHCGIYRIERPSEKWERVGDHMPRDIGDIGFPITLHPRDPDTAWVFPMDGTQVWPRTSPGGRPSVYVTHDAGRSWQRQDAGLPARNAWLTVLRQAMAADARDPVGLYFGTTHGELWASRDEGASWQCIVRNLPHVYAVEVAEPEA